MAAVQCLWQALADGKSPTSPAEQRDLMHRFVVRWAARSAKKCLDHNAKLTAQKTDDSIKRELGAREPLGGEINNAISVVHGETR